MVCLSRRELNPGLERCRVVTSSHTDHYTTEELWMCSSTVASCGSLASQECLYWAGHPAPFRFPLFATPPPGDVVRDSGTLVVVYKEAECGLETILTKSSTISFYGVYPREESKSLRTKALGIHSQVSGRQNNTLLDFSGDERQTSANKALHASSSFAILLTI
jgi:hypothetical protein